MYKKRTVVISGLILISLIVLSTTAVASQRGHFFKQPANQEEMAIKNRIDAEVNNFKSQVDEDIANAFTIELTSLEKIDHKALGTDSFKPFETVFIEVITQQKTGDVLPSIYINGNTGYILEKKADGTNVVYRIEKNQNVWTILQKESKPGKYIEPPQ